MSETRVYRPGGDLPNVEMSTMGHALQDNSRLSTVVQQHPQMSRSGLYMYLYRCRT